MQLNKSGKKHIIVYEEILTISHIQLQQTTYKKVLQLAQPVILQISAINSVDTASLQLLLSFLLAAKQQGIICTWQGYSSALYCAALLLGMEQLLGLPKQTVQSNKVVE